MSASSRTVQRDTLAVVCVTTAMLMLDIAVVNTALPAIALDLHAGMSSLQWVVDAYTLALATVVLSAGSWADRRGRRRVFSAGLVIFILASAGCAAAQNIWVLDAARAVQGVGGAILFACSLALLAHAFPEPKARAGALAAYGATIGGSFAVGPLVGGVLTEHLSWQAIFLLNVPIGLVAMMITARWVAESRDPQPRGADVPGQLLVCLGLGALVLGLLRGNEDGWTSALPLTSLIVAALALAAFITVERRHPEPMLPLEMFRNRFFTGAQLAAFAISSSMFAVFVYTTFYLQGVLHLTPIQAGLVYLPGTVVMFFVAGATASISQRVPVALTLAGSLLLVTAGLVLSLSAGVDSNRWALVPGFLVSCVGAGVFNPIMSGIVLGESSSRHSGLAAGINDAFRQTGIAVGVAGLGALLPAGSVFTGEASAADFVDGLHVALIVSAVIALAGAIACLVLLRPVQTSALEDEFGAELTRELEGELV